MNDDPGIPRGAEPQLSIVIPFCNEEGAVAKLLAEIREEFPSAEIVAVDDGSTDKTGELLAKIPGIRFLRHASRLGQSAAILTGLNAATGTLLALMDGDGQNDPHDLHALLRAWEPGIAVIGFRQSRKDALHRRIAGRIANAIRRRVLDDDSRDTGCGLKVFHRDVLPLLVPFRATHRFIPALLKSGGVTIREVPVRHRPRLSGYSKYDILGRAIEGVVDLFRVRELLKKRRC